MNRILPRRVLVAFAVVAASASFPLLAGAANAAKTPTTKSAGVKSAKAPIAGNFCKKTAKGTTALSAKGVTLTCKADAKGALRWTK